MFFRFRYVALSLSLITFLFSYKASAEFGDTLIIVGASTLAGSILGASTLPFYETPGDHTDNIYIGAAIGAVVGVGIAAYSAVSDEDNFDVEEYEEGASLGNLKIRMTKKSLSQEVPQHKLLSQNTSLAPSFARKANNNAVWTSIAAVQF